MEKEEARIIYEAGLGAGQAAAPRAARQLAAFRRRHRKKLLLRISAATAAAVAALLLTLPLLSDRNTVVPQGPDTVYIVDNRGNKVSVEEASRSIENTVRVGDASLRYVPAENPEPGISMNTLTVPKENGIFTLILSDGTTVKINSGSRLTYPTDFATEGERRVEVEYGEVFFDVAHDERRPFVVRAAQGDTRVLGTKFNIRATGGQDCDVTLVDGAVVVKQQQQSWDDAVAIVPGQNASVTAAGIEVTSVELQNYIAWVEGYYFYDRKSADEILESICSNYGYRMDGTPGSTDQVRFWFDETEEMASVLERLGSIANMEITLEGDRILLN